MTLFQHGHALAIGVGTYQDSAWNAPPAAADASEFATALKDPAVGGYPDGQVDILLNAQATRKNVQTALERLAKRVTAADTVVIFFCGHGVPGDDGQYYFATHDTTFTIAPAAQAKAKTGTGLSAPEILGLLRKIKSRKLLFLINACLSGHLGDALRPSDVLGAPLSAGLVFEVLGTGEGRVLITASREGQPSIYIRHHKHTYFGQALIDGLRGAVVNSGGYVGLHELYNHVHASVMEKTNGAQEPVLKILYQVGPFPVALYPGASPVALDKAPIQQTPSPGTAAVVLPFQAPLLPPHYVHRPEVEDLASRWQPPDPTPARLVISVVHGMPGVGKSILAAALAHRLRRQFPDGVLWAPLSQQPDLLRLLSVWIQALGDRTFQATSEEEASLHLRSLLRDKAVLLIVDDAWEPDHVSPFLVGGPHCRVLVTTRTALIAKLGADRCDLGVMNLNQALELLARCLKREIKGTEKEQAHELAQAVGYLPLALQLAAAEVADGLSWAKLCEDLKAEVDRRLKAVEGPGAKEVKDEALRKRLSLDASFHLSLRRLAPPLREDFAWLGVLANNATLTPAVAATLWKRKEDAVLDTLRYLHDKALLLRGGALPDGTATYRLHNLVRDQALGLLAAPVIPAQPGELPGLGLAEQEAQAKFLVRYREQTKGGQWHTLPDDGYIHAHLVWHLELAQRSDEIHALLREENAQGLNGWYQERDRRGDLAGYLADVGRAWRLAEQASSTQAGAEIGLEIRYRLIVASLNSLAQNVPPALLAALAANEVWKWPKALAYTRQVPDPTQQAEALTVLGPHLPAEFLAEALKLAGAIKDANACAHALGALAPRLKLVPGLSQKALAVVEAIGDETARARALSALAEHLAEWLLSRALDLARAIKLDAARATALAGLAHFCVSGSLQEEVGREALEAAGKVEADRGARLLAELAPNIPDRLFEEVVAAVGALQSEHTKAEALVKLAPVLPERLLPKALDQALSLNRWDEDTSGQYRAPVLAALAPRLSRSLWLQALEGARAIWPTDHRAAALVPLARHLPPQPPDTAQSRAVQWARWLWLKLVQPFRLSTNGSGRFVHRQQSEVLHEAFAGIRALADERAQAEVLRTVAGHLSEPLLHEALTLARRMREGTSRVKALTALAEHLPDSLWEEVLKEVQPSSRESYQSLVLAHLDPKLPECWKKQALDAALALNHEPSRARALAGLALFLPEHLQEKAFNAARGIELGRERAEALVALAPHLPRPMQEGGIREALEAALAVDYEGFRAEALRLLAPHLPQAVEDHALGVARALQIGRHRTEALTALGAHLSGAWRQALREALDAARTVGSPAARARVLRDLAAVPRLLPSLKTQAVREALDTVRMVRPETIRVQFLVWLAPLIPAHLWDGVLEMASTIGVLRGSPEKRAELLAALLPHLPSKLLPRAQAMIQQKVSGTTLQAKLWAQLAHRLPGTRQEEFRQQAMTAATHDSLERWRAEALLHLAPELPEPSRREVLQQAAAAARQIEGEKDRADLLAAAALQLSGPEQQEVAREALDALQGVGQGPGGPQEWDERFQADVLAALASSLAEPLLDEALKIARKIKWSEHRAQVLVQLARHLPEPQRGLIVAEAFSALGEKHGATGAWPAKPIARLAPNLPGEFLAVALEAVKRSDFGAEREEVLAGIASYLPRHLAPQALALAQNIWDEDRRAKALVALVPRLPEGFQGEVLTTTCRIHSVNARASALVALAPYLPEPLLPQALAAARALTSEEARLRALDALAPRLPKALLSDAFAATTVQEIRDEKARAEALIALAPHLSEGFRVEAARTAGKDLGWSRTLRVLGKHLPELPFREALVVARETKSEWERAGLLAALAPSLPETLAGEALAMARGITDAAERVKVLAALCASLPEALRAKVREEALAAAESLSSPEDRAEALAALPQPFAGARWEESLRTALLTAMRDPASGIRRVRVLEKLADRVPSELMSEALTIIRDIGDLPRPADIPVGSWRLTRANAQKAALAALIPHVPEQLLEEAMAVVLSIEETSYRCSALVHLAPRLSEALLSKALEAFRTIEHERFAPLALAALASRISGPQQEELLRKALDRTQDVGRTLFTPQLLAGMAPYLPEPLLREALAVALQLPAQKYYKVEALAQLIAHRNIPLGEAELREVLGAAQESGTGEGRGDLLAALGPSLLWLPRNRLPFLWRETLHALGGGSRQDLLALLSALPGVLTAPGEEESLAETFRAIQDVGRWWP